MSFFNLFFKNLIGCKIKESDLICNNSIKKNNPDYLNVSLSLSDSKEKYTVNKVIDKLKLDDRQYTINDYESFSDQLQKISDELDRLKLSDTFDGGERFKRKLDFKEKKIDKSDNDTLPKKRPKLVFNEMKIDESNNKADQNVSGNSDFNKMEIDKSDDNTSHDKFEQTYKSYDNKENLKYIEQFYIIPKNIS